MSHRRDQSIVPNSNYRRTTFLARASSELGVPGLSADVKANYVREDAKNRPRVSDAPGNPNYVTALMPPSMDVEILSPGWVGNNKFNEQLVTNSIFVTNPYWAVNRFSNTDTDDRLSGFVQLQYDIGAGITLQGRGELSTYWTNRRTIEPYGTNYIPGGSLDDTEYHISEYNYSFQASTTQSLTSNISLSARLGGNIRQERTKILGQTGTNFNIPGLRTIQNTSNQSPIYDFSRSEVWSAYGTADISYKDYAYLNLSGRNDIASTLPVDNNSYFYPSASGSFVFSEAFDVPDWLSFGKVRGAWGYVGGDTSPYQLNLTYELTGHSHTNPNGTGVPVGQIATGSVPNAELEPSKKETIEAGLELGFFSDRVTFDFTWYRETTTDDIVPTTIPSTSGYTSRILNVGKTRNTGIEVSLRTTPIQTGDFEWDLNINFSQNNNEVLRITEDLNQLQLSQPRSRQAFVRAREGEPYGAIMAYKYKRDDQGRLILDSNGLPQRRDSLTVAGHFPPDWRGGITNTFRYKGFVVEALLDVQKGGSIYSGTNEVATANGLHAQTLRGREQGYVKVSGVDANGNPTTARVSPQTYWGRISTISNEF
ncbi:MAG: SusC/RagA family TonB-linked outer membrane protein, partial [Salinibacter sp.]